MIREEIVFAVGLCNIYLTKEKKNAAVMMLDNSIVGRNPTI